MVLRYPLIDKFRRSLNTVKQSFSDILLNDQDFLNDESTLGTFLSMLPDSTIICRACQIAYV